MKKIDVSVIVVAYNSKDTIVGCVNSVLDSVKSHSFEIIISDNSQNLDTEKVVEEKFGKNENVIFIHNSQNLGFSKGNNVGVKKAQGNYVLFLNPDTKVYEHTIDGMIEFMREHPLS